VSEEYPYAAKAKVTTLVESLEMLIKRDPEQEVEGDRPARSGCRNRGRPYGPAG
jgi:hypothetical protein